jgi:hypothetical protein
MKFPLGACVLTKDLDATTAVRLLRKLKEQGYGGGTAILDSYSNANTGNLFYWNYLGVDQYGDISFYDVPYGFLPPNAWQLYSGVLNENYPNIIPKEQLNQFL